MIRTNYIKTIALTGGLALAAAACTTERTGRFSDTDTPRFYAHTSGGTPVYSAQAGTGGADIDQRRIDESDPYGPGATRGDRTSADPTETSSQGAGSRALVGQTSDPAFGTERRETTTMVEAESETAQGGGDIDEGAATSASRTEGEQVVIPLYKETLNVGKREVDAGTVTVRKQVQTETVNQPVELRSETVTIDRQPAQGGSEAEGSANFAAGSETSGQPFEQKEFTIQLKREEPVVEKRVVPAGQIVARTQVQVQQTNIQSQVRTEDVQINQGQDRANVNISQDLREDDMDDGQQETTAVGGSTQTGENTFPSGQGTAITELSMLSGNQAATMAGRTVNLSDAKIRAIAGPQVIALDAGDKPVYVHLQQPASNLREGMRVKVNGTVKTPNQLSSGNLSGEGAHVLSAQPVYIEAQSVQSNQ